ncbi:HD-GYP domain-containing protein [Desulfovibrio psychrotolerans]|uniref:HD family phosphohydrolase n=1 Tax=Desulfovibrio psychrotolerans TaxID=415242 RepID=A0A7J0BTD1_9BACT|nr:HD domain-containing phosphohydrolase [Desulfovibrio psychrotolerans]GFM36976.1 HD family phosphohydrolase [Desulfovibrio psychrotolerans]
MTQAAFVQPRETRDDEFFAVPPAMLLRGMRGAFSLYLKQGREYVLYTHAGEEFDERHQRVLMASGVQCVFVREHERPEYRQHVVDNLGRVLGDENIPLPTRAQIFYEASLEVVEDIFANKLPPTIRREQFNRVFEFVTKGVSFLTLENSIRTMASLIAHDYHTFSHSLHVFIYSQVILQTYGFDDRNLVQFGLGAMLHDIGKTFIDESILNKPGPLSWEERGVVNEHPVLGAGACTLMPLSQDALNCVLFHHEKMDGTGYPCGLKGEEIPLPVRAVTIADIYDALCSERPYARARNAFQVLRIMRDEMGHGLDLDVFARFVRILSGAGMV